MLEGMRRRDVLLSPLWLGAARGQGVTVRAITRGPKFHWFGYYDKLQFDPTGRYVLGMEVGFEGGHLGRRMRSG